jgi:hypothetical protein
LNRDGTTDATEEKMKSVEPPINANKNYLRSSALIGGSNLLFVFPWRSWRPWRPWRLIFQTLQFP